MELQDEINYFKTVDIDNLFSSTTTRSQHPLRAKVAAHVLQLRREMDDCRVTTFQEDMAELAERLVVVVIIVVVVVGGGGGVIVVVVGTPTEG